MAAALSNRISTFKREGIIIALDRRFVVYPGLAGVDEGAGLEDIEHEVPLLHWPLLHRHLHQAQCLLQWLIYTGTSIA